MDIVIKNLGKDFGEKKVLHRFGCIFKSGDITCIMGKSGCGKTTLLNILMGIEKKYEGTVEGMEGKKISAVFQEDRLFESFTVYQNIRAACGKRCTRDDVFGNLRMVGLAGEIDKETATLSGGMKRRVAIVRAVMAESGILIMDEPFKGLDENTKGDVIKYVLENIKGRTVIITTHDEDEVEALGGNVLMMEG